MKFDNYCIALVVLILFFLYLDNSMNIEGMAPVDPDSDDSDTKPPSPPPQLDVRKPQVEQPASKQNMEPIGAKPQKLSPVNTPASMKSGLAVVSKDSSNLSSLDAAFAPLIDPKLIPNQVPADLESLGSRVGGTGNLGDSNLGGMGGPVPSGAVGAASKGPVPYTDMDELMGSPLMGAMPGQPLAAPAAPKPAAPKPAAPAAPAAPTAPAAPAAPAAPKPAVPKGKVELHMVYTNWCGHSKRALPDFDKVQKEYHGKDMGSHVVEVYKHDADTPEGKQVAKDNNVRGFPTHFFIVEGKKIEKGVGRTYDELVAKIHELTGN